MIGSLRHRGLKRLYERGDRSRLPPDLVPKIERILARLDEAAEVENMNLPGYRLHPLKGKRLGYWSVWVSGNWRVIFRFENGTAHDVDLVDYH